MDELDRILSEEEPVSPPKGFAQQVMALVMQEASAPPPIPFPWRYVLATLVAIVSTLIACWLLWPLIPSSALLSKTASNLPRIDPVLLAWCSSFGAALIGLLRYSVRFVT
jgi:hypothetical protein